MLEWVQVGFGIMAGALSALIIPVAVMFILGMVSAYLRRRRREGRKNARKNQRIL